MRGVESTIPASVSRGEEGRGRAHSALGRLADLVAAVVAVALIGYLDSRIGAVIDLGLVYVFPLAWATWRVSRRAGGAIAILCAVTDTIVDLRLTRYRAEPLQIAWNVSIEFTLLLLAAWAVDLIRRNLATEAYLHGRLRDVHARLDREVQRVADVQQSLLPGALPRVPGYEIAVHYEMSVRAGGDYYDFFPLPEGGRLGVLVADATGHGPAAAVVMAMARVVVQGSRDSLPRPSRLLQVANGGLWRVLSLPNFLTACYAVLDPASGTVEFALAGHPLPILGRARERDAAEVGVAQGPPLGVDSDAAYATQSVRLAPGDVLVLYTDGLPEARREGGALLGTERILACVAESAGRSAQAVVHGLADEIERHLDGAAAEDDVTIVAVRRASAPDGPEDPVRR